MLTLTVTARNTKDSADALRATGLTPCVIYGPKEAPQSISVSTALLESTWKQAGESALVILEGIASPRETLMHDVQIHPVTGRIVHADFYALEKGKKVEVTVPLHFVGECPAEKAGLILVKSIYEIDIEVAATELPHHLDVSLTTLVGLEDQITAGDIVLPKSAVLKTDPDEVLVSVTEFKEVNEEAQLPTKESLAEPVATDAKTDTEEK